MLNIYVLVDLSTLEYVQIYQWQFESIILCVACFGWNIEMSIKVWFNSMI